MVLLSVDKQQDSHQHHSCSLARRSKIVLGSARTGLIFTRIQEGAQPGGLTQPQPGQTEPGIPYHVPSCWVPGGRGGAAGTLSQFGSWRWRSWKATLRVVRFMFCFLLFCTVVVPVPSVCCSVKLPISRPTSFCLFLSILLRTVAGGGAAVWHFCCRLQLNQNKNPRKNFLMPIKNYMETDFESQFDGTNSKNSCQTPITVCRMFVLCLENLHETNSYFTALFSLLVSTLQSPKTLAKA